MLQEERRRRQKEERIRKKPNSLLLSNDLLFSHLKCQPLHLLLLLVSCVCVRLSASSASAAATHNTTQEAAVSDIVGQHSSLGNSFVPVLYDSHFSPDSSFGEERETRTPFSLSFCQKGKTCKLLTLLSTSASFSSSSSSSTSSSSSSSFPFLLLLHCNPSLFPSRETLRQIRFTHHDCCILLPTVSFLQMMQQTWSGMCQD